MPFPFQQPFALVSFCRLSRLLLCIQFLQSRKYLFPCIFWSFCPPRTYLFPDRISGLVDHDDGRECSKRAYSQSDRLLQVTPILLLKRSTQKALWLSMEGA